jgi:hypothetical protein
MPEACFESCMRSPQGEDRTKARPVADTERAWRPECTPVYLLGTGESVKTPKGDPLEDQAGGGARAFASAAETVCTTAGDREAETGRVTLSCSDVEAAPSMPVRRDFARSMRPRLLGEFAQICGIM